MPDPHASAVAYALRTNKALARLFDAMGNTEHPRGRILAAYRQARRAMRGAVESPVQTRLVLEELERSLKAIMADLLAGAVEAGIEQGHAELKLYDLPAAEPDNITRLGFDIAEGWGAVIDGQLNAVYAMVLTGAADEAMILGGEDRLGMLTPQPVINEGTRWLGMAAVEASRRMVTDAVKATDQPIVEKVPSPEEIVREKLLDAYARQAIAAIDERTTDCCLRVHGSITAIDGYFVLTGTPRFANILRAPPFHWNCRTAVALVRLRDIDDELSQQMRGAANAELKARERVQKRIDKIKAELVKLEAKPHTRITKEDSKKVRRLRNQLRRERAKLRVEIHPAHARSRPGAVTRVRRRVGPLP